jgi:DNA topoisomerase-1
MALVIVESPTKAKTIGKFLGEEHTVTSSYGHVRDLPKSKLGIDPEKDFEAHYIIPTRVRKRVTELKKQAAKADAIILATDEDREGEAIAWHLVQALGLEESAKKVRRIVFHEITKKAIGDALEHPRAIDMNLVDAQQGRRILDRLVGYKLSPFLWKKVAGGLSAGRVQSAALRLIVDREQEIKAFKPQEYWTIETLLANGREETFTAGLAKKNDKVLDKFAITNEAEARAIAGAIKGAEVAVVKVEEKEVSKNPLPPFTTSTLQQEAVKRLRYSSKKTMLLAQRLYENGHITYMRTDSVNLSVESTLSAKAWLEKNLGTEYSASAPRVFTSKSKLAQEAHEAIRPTNPDQAPTDLRVEDAGEKKLYTLIWERFMASQMPAARFKSITLECKAKAVNPADTYLLRANGQRTVFDGYLKIWKQNIQERPLPLVQRGELLSVREVSPEQHFTEPPPRYSEASLIKALEEFGIGRPSTYVPIISVIQTRNYVIKEAGRFHPTDIGELVNRVLTEHFPEIVDIGFTARMENELDDIAEGQRSWQTVLREFYDPFAKHLEKKYEEVSKDSLVKQETTEEICEKCGKPMVVKMSRFGKFLGCSGFPECRNTKKLGASGGRAEAPKTIGMKCPKCAEGDVIEKRVHRGRARGKIFWGCSRYPDCDFASWDNPLEPPKEKTKKRATGKKAAAPGGGSADSAAA